MGKYGYFTEDGLEFVITRPDTPQPWINYSINGRYHALISNTGGGFSYFISPLNGRITRRRYNALPEDRPGRYLYIRDNRSAEYYSPTWQPTLTELEDYECRHGRGYTTITSKYKGLKHKVTFFVPKDKDVEIWRYTIENVGGDRDLSLFPYVEWVPGDALDDLVEQPNNAHFKEAFFSEKCNALIAENKIGVSYLPEDQQDKDEGCWGKVAFMSFAGLPVHGFETEREKFVGSVYRSEQNPKCVEDGKLTNSRTTSGHFCGALQSNLTLKAGETLEFCVVVGVADRLDNAYEKQITSVMKDLNSMEKVDASYDNLRKYYDEFYSKVVVDTPVQKVNNHLNVWNKIQLETTFRCGRDASRYHLGLSYGVGYRDAAQDLLGFIMFQPEGAKEMIKELFAHMFVNGYVYHHFYRAQASGHVFTNHSDDPLWMAIALAYYLRETEDYSILDEVVPYRALEEVPTKEIDGVLHCANGFNDSVVPFWNDIPEYVKDHTKGTVLEHLCVGIDKVWKCRSERDIPLMLGGDWNDDLNECGKQGKGESMMVAEQLALAFKYFEEIFEYDSNKNRSSYYEAKKEEYKKAYEVLKKSINEIGWDGDWFWRLTCDENFPNRKEGSKENKEGSMYLNSQTWAVIAGVAEGEKATKCLDSVLKNLDFGHGPLICAPEYTKSDASIGAATREAPGKKENASTFNHPVTWFIQANALLGRGNEAFRQYWNTLPPNLSDDQDKFVVEPYVYPEYTTGPSHPDHGRGGHSWLTGTAPWMFIAGVEFILGLKPWYNGLVIDPCIPASWPGFKATRVFRGTTYNINVINPDSVERGVKEVLLDGKKIEGNKIPDLRDGKEHEVLVTMGK
ncbi:N,N'-diacetylchitobiose/cellobiose phosphorylase [Chitinispirillum alkaliphilum]|nr:N,N'-diacetylchitobiose/cellobiose phosphorylase [Chitinispirillum alkaliphilum]